jgi:glycerol-3-phosphate dehydrogenase
MAAVAEIASLVAGPLRWDARQTAREVAHYRAGAAAERASQEAGTDADADAIRETVHDIVPVLDGGDGNGVDRMGGGVAGGVGGRSH